MPGPALSLGSLVFRGFEIPSSIMFGGRQRTAVRFLTSGDKAIDVLGPDDRVIDFAGSLTGPNATARAHEIDALRTAGQIMDLSWNDFHYTVLIQKFEATFRSRWWIDYKIRCLALQNSGAGFFASVLSAADKALTALNAMYDVIPASLLPMTDPRSALMAASPARVSAIADDLQGCIGTLAAQQRQVEPTLAGTPLDTPTATSRFPVDYGAVLDTAETLQYLALAQAYLGQSRACLVRGASS